MYQKKFDTVKKEDIIKLNELKNLLNRDGYLNETDQALFDKLNEK